MSIYFEIEADDPARAMNFYSQVFGSRFSEDQRSRTLLADRSRRIVRRVVSAVGDPLPSQRGANAFVCSFEVENFDATEQTIRQLGGSVVESKFYVTGQSWQGYFMDAEGTNFGISTNRFASRDREVATGSVPDCGGA